MPTKDDREKRQSIIDACLRMNTLGINQGTSGNISLRHGEGMLVTPTSTKVPGGNSSLNEPQAESDTRSVTPARFSTSILAR